MTSPARRPFGYVPDFRAQTGLKNWLKNMYFSLVGTPFYIRRVEARVLYRLLGDPTKPRRVVELGSSDGLFTFPLASREALAIGVDLSSRALCRGRWRASLMNLSDKIHFLQADATALPIKNDTIDAIFANSTLEHIPADEAVLAEVLRVLRPQGVFVVTVPADLVSQTSLPRPLPALLIKAPQAIRSRICSYALAESASMRDYLERSIEDYDHARFGYSEEEITHKLRHAGFEILTIRRYLKFFGGLGVDATQALRVFGIRKGGPFGYEADHEIVWGMAAPVFSAISRLDDFLPASASSIAIAVKARKPPDKGKH